MKRWSVSNLRTVAGVCVFLGVCVTIAVLCLTLGRTTKGRGPPFNTGGDMLDYLMHKGKISAKDRLLVSWSHGANNKSQMEEALKSRGPPFNTGGDMLDYLMHKGNISAKDGLLVSWSHGANNKSQMEEALKSEIMVLEADINVEGYGTKNQTNIPIMAHPPAVYSDNTLQEWMDAVVGSSKGIKLDFKSIEAVAPSLDILNAKASKGEIRQPIWLNADIVKGPNVNHTTVDASQFLHLVQTKFPDVTISPGWVTLYLPPIISNRTYTWEMIQNMYNLVKSVPQRVTFPSRAVLTRSAWPHFNWLLQQSDWYTLTLWQGTSDPLTLEDLLFVRDNSHPEKIYYDIYDPLLSEFKQIALNQTRKRLYYSGGSLQQYFHPEDDDGLLVRWYDAEGDVTVLQNTLDANFGMITFNVEMQKENSKLVVAVVLSKSSPGLPLETGLKLISNHFNPWGVFLNIKDHTTLNETLRVLKQQYEQKALYFPVWISMEVSCGESKDPGYIKGEDFIGSINDIFPFVTIAPSWPETTLGQGYTGQMVEDMLKVCRGLWQEVSFLLHADALGRSLEGAIKLKDASPIYSLTVQHDSLHGDFMDGYKGLMTIRSHTENKVYYKLPPDYRSLLLTSIYTS